MAKQLSFCKVDPSHGFMLFPTFFLFWSMESRFGLRKCLYLAIVGGSLLLVGCILKTQSLPHCPSTAFSDKIALILQEMDGQEPNDHGPRFALKGKDGFLDQDSMLAELPKLSQMDLPDRNCAYYDMQQPQTDLQIHKWGYRAEDGAHTQLIRWDYAPLCKNRYGDLVPIALTYFQIERDIAPRRVDLLIGDGTHIEGLRMDRDTISCIYEDRLVVLDSVEREFYRVLGYHPFRRHL
jgi:hypothetical protein